jgi:hypothetical protein
VIKPMLDVRERVLREFGTNTTPSFSEIEACFKKHHDVIAEWDPSFEKIDLEILRQVPTLADVKMKSQILAALPSDLGHRTEKQSQIRVASLKSEHLYKFCTRDMHEKIETVVEALADMDQGVKPNAKLRGNTFYDDVFARFPFFIRQESDVAGVFLSGKAALEKKYTALKDKIKVESNVTFDVFDQFRVYEYLMDEAMQVDLSKTIRTTFADKTVVTAKPPAAASSASSSSSGLCAIGAKKTDARDASKANLLKYFGR